MNELPSGWVSVQLGDLLTNIVGGGTPSKANANYFQGTIPFMTVKDMHARFIEDTQDHITQEALDDSASTLIPADTLVIASRMSLGKISRPKVPTAINQDLKALFLHKEVNKTYMEYAWRANESRIQAMGTGTTVKGIRLEDIRGLPVPLAPSEEQRRIANHLDILLSRINACQNRLNVIPALLKRYKQAVLDAALSGQLTESWREAHGVLLEEWKSITIGEISEVGTGSTPLRSNSGYFSTSGTPWVTSAATGRAFVDSAEVKVTPAAIAAHRLKIYAPGTLLVAMYGEGKTRGQVSELRIHAAINQACAAINVDQRQASTSFIKLALLAQYEQMRALAEGGNQPNLNLSKIRGIPIRLPSEREQAEIVRRVELLLKFTNRIDATLSAANTQTRRLAPLTLAKAFRGELVEQNLQDEPASVLLQRIAGNQPEKLKTTRGRRRVEKPETVEALPVTQPDWSTLPAAAWAAQVPADEHSATAQLTAVLKVWNKPMPQDTARLATLLCLQPRLLTAALPADQAAPWRRLVGDAATPLPAQVVTLQPAFNTPWRNAISKMRARGDLVDSGSGPQGTWTLGPDAARVDTAGWPDGRAGWVVHYLQTHGVEAVLPALAAEVQEFVDARAA